MATEQARKHLQEPHGKINKEADEEILRSSSPARTGHVVTFLTSVCFLVGIFLCPRVMIISHLCPVIAL